jgi:LPXTG-motif cell wall-anchored protein
MFFHFARRLMFGAVIFAVIGTLITLGASSARAGTNPPDLTAPGESDQASAATYYGPDWGTLQTHLCGEPGGGWDWDLKLGCYTPPPFTGDPGVTSSADQPNEIVPDICNDIHGSPEAVSFGPYWVCAAQTDCPRFSRGDDAWEWTASLGCRIRDNLPDADAFGYVPSRPCANDAGKSGVWVLAGSASRLAPREHSYWYRGEDGYPLTRTGTWDVVGFMGDSWLCFTATGAAPVEQPTPVDPPNDDGGPVVSNPPTEDPTPDTPPTEDPSPNTPPVDVPAVDPPAEDPADDTPVDDDPCNIQEGSSTTVGCVPPGVLWECPVDARDDLSTVESKEWFDFLADPNFFDDLVDEYFNPMGVRDSYDDDARELTMKKLKNDYENCLTFLRPPPITKLPKSGGDTPTPWLGLAGLGVLTAAGTAGVIVTRRRSHNGRG